MTGPDYVISSDGARIACFSQGTGPPLIMLHGGGNDHTFAPELTDLLARQYRVIKPDRRGRGASGDHPDYSAGKEADDLCAVIATCADPPIVFGNSYGAFVALIALCRPIPPVRRVVLFEPPFETAANADRQRAVKELQALVQSGNTDAAVVFHQTVFHRRSAKEMDTLRANAVDWALRRSRVATTAREMRLLHCEHLFDPSGLRDPGCGIDLLYGSDTLVFLRHCAASLSTVGFVRAHRLEGVTHSGPVTHPGLIAGHIMGLD